MLTTSSRIRIQEILKRLANGELVTLQERIYLNKYAARDQTVYSWLRKASNLQKNQTSEKPNPIDEIIEGLDLLSSDPQSSYNPKEDDLGEWFSGAPSWIRRS